MQNLISFLLLSLLLSTWSCKEKVADYTLKTQLDPQERALLLDSFIRYVAKLPKGVSHEAKFDSSYQSYYQNQKQQYRISHYFQYPQSDTVLLVLMRPAPSLMQKEVGIAIKYLLDNNKNLTYYEEVFWTFKQKTELINQKINILMQYYLKNGHVNPYLPQNTADEWVEFPDLKNKFDTQKRRWVTIAPQ